MRAIKDYIKEHGYAPTIREIGEMVGMSSLASVHHHITYMYENGLIERDAPNSARAFRITKKGDKWG